MKLVSDRRSTNQLNQKSSNTQRWGAENSWKTFWYQIARPWQNSIERETGKFLPETNGVWFLHLSIESYSMLVIQSICCFGAVDEGNRTRGGRSLRVSRAWRWGWGWNCFQSEIDKCLFCDSVYSTSISPRADLFSSLKCSIFKAFANRALNLLKLSTLQLLSYKRLAPAVGG